MKIIRHTHSCIHQNGFKKGIVTFSQRTSIYTRKTDAGWKKYREVICEGERKGAGGGGGGQEESLRGPFEVIDETLVDLTDSREAWEVFATRAWWMRLRVATQLSFGNFPVSRGCRPFFAPHASEQLSLVSASMEGPTNFRSKFSDCCGAQSVRELKNELTSAGIMLAWTIPTAAMALTVNSLDVSFSLEGM